MKDLSIVSALMVSIIFTTIAYFFAFSASFKVPIASKTGHHNSVIAATQNISKLS